MKSFSYRTINSKIFFLGCISVFITAVALVWMALWQSAAYNDLAQNEVDRQIDNNLNSITRGVYNLVETENKSVQQQVSRNLDVMRHLLDILGGIYLSDEKVTWEAINQFSGEKIKLELPRIVIGEKLLEVVSDFDEDVSLVDLVTRLTGATATIFQRMNEQGDMLRVATTVPTKDNKRAIKTYIPAVNPDGRENTVVKTILAGKIYNGVAYVVNQNYITSYKPLRDNEGKVIGMFYVGVKQKEAENRIRRAIINTSVGRTGYVYVVSGKGPQKGSYVISKNGEQDGVNVINVIDSDGNYITKSIIENTINNKPGEYSTFRYKWQNPGEDESRWKIARTAYYKPWDWIIGTSVYEDELDVYKTVLSTGREKTSRFMALAGILIIFVVGVSSFFLTRSITRPINIVTESAKKISQGVFEEIPQISTHDEVGILINTFNYMIQTLKQTLENMQKSEERYRDIFENVPGGIFRCDDEKFFDVNPVFAKMFGYESPQEMVKDITSIRKQLFYDPKEMDLLLEFIHKNEKIQGYEILVKKRDGSLFWGSINVIKVLTEHGEMISYQGSAEDITMRKRAELALKESEMKFRQIADNVNEGFAVFSKSNNMNLYMNNAFRKMFDLRANETISVDDLGGFVFDEDKKNVASIYSRAKKYSLQHRIIVGEQIRWIRNRVFPVKNEHGQTYRIVNIISDITDFKEFSDKAKQQEMQLMQADKMVSLGILVAGVGHEINNPNNFIMLNINLIRDVWKSALPILDKYYQANGDFIMAGMNYSEISKDVLPLIEGVLNGSKRIQKIVANLKDYARQDDYNLEEEVDLNKVITAAVTLLNNMINKKTNYFSLSLSSEPLIVKGNFQRIEQVIINLIQNSCDSLANKNKKIIVQSEADKEKKCARILVEDEGMGISSENLEKIQDPFFTTKRSVGGTGLGLSVSAGIVKDHKGELKFESVPGEGTKAILLFPFKGEAK